MPNGKPGDHPYTDIVGHRKDLYSPKAAKLVREIHRIGTHKDRDELGDLLIYKFDPWSKPDVEKLEQILTDMHARVLKEARKERGLEE